MVVSTDDNNNNNNSNEEEGPIIYGKKVSSVGPARVTGDLSYKPCNLDLAMKLHYLRIVYIFEVKLEEASLVEEEEVLKWPNFKEAIFSWLSYYYETCGRFRRESPDDDNTTDGRPYIKCNDCGIRFVEAKSSKTLQQWLQLKDATPHHRFLVPNHVIASGSDDITFSPIVFIQVTSFKCGGMSVGLSWAHALGDAFSASDFMNSWGKFMKGQVPTYPPNLNKSPPPNTGKPITDSLSGPLSLKEVGPTEDNNWIFPTPCDMDTFSFHVTSSQLGQLRLKMSKTDTTSPSPSPIGHFEALSAVIWRSIAKVRNETETETEPNTVVTVITQGGGRHADDDMMLLRNNQVMSSVKAHFCVSKAHPEDLAILIRDKAYDERALIHEMVARCSDFVLYGSNLTFVDWSEAHFYGFEFKGVKPRLVNCFVDGIGEEGVVLVLPTTPHHHHHHGINNYDATGGRVVTLILPNKYMKDLKEELHKEWDLIV